MAQNCLPQIDIRLDKNNKGLEPIIHSVNKFTKRKSTNYQPRDWIKRAAIKPHQNINQFVRISFSNKTTLFKRKRIAPIQSCHRASLAPLQCHQTKKIMILNQSPKSETQPNMYDLRGCKSFLNPKGRKRASLIDLGNKIGGEDTKKHRHNRSLVQIDSVDNITHVSANKNHQQFTLCPWNQKQAQMQKQNKYGRYR